jgi:NAD(P)-dependent dehydrogenase (short-subunit alcohol dehydrogenase family)
MTDARSRILIVGGNSGMGLALAEHCLGHGAGVIIVGRDKEKLDRARENLDAHSRLETMAADITKEEQVAELFR